MPFSRPETYDQIIGGPGVIFYTADLTVAVPTKLDDICSLTTPYTPKAGWLDGGPVTRDAIDLARTLAISDISTGHTNVPIARRVTNTNRQLTVPFQAFSPVIQALAENGATIATVAVGAAASGTPAQSKVPLGTVNQIAIRRIAIIAERDPGISGVTTEGGTRGQLFGIILYRVGISASASNISLDPDTIASRSVVLDTYPETTISDVRQQTGFLAFEVGVVIP